MEDFKNVLNDICLEYNFKLKQMSEEFGSRIEEMDDADWTETELIAYDLGFSKALMIVIDILKENGVE